MQRKAVMVVSTTPVFPCTQGNRRVIKQLLEWLRSEGYFTIFVHQAKSVSDQVRDQHLAVCDVYRLASVQVAKRSSWGKFLDRLRRFAARLLRIRIISSPLSHRLASFIEPEEPSSQVRATSQVRKTWSCWPETRVIVRALLAKYRCQAVIAEYHFLAAIFDGMPNRVLKIVQTHDACSRLAEVVGALGGDTQGRAISFEEERARLLKADVIIAIQEEEREYFSSMLPERRVITIGYAAESGALGYLGGSRQADDKVVLFVGSANALNVRGVEQFLTYAWPEILRKQPLAVCVIAGAVCERLRPIETQNVELLGVVVDLAQEWRRAAIVINPVDLGTGLKIKSIEAISLGKALVSTPEGVAGISRGSDREPFLVAKNWREFSEQINLLLADPARIKCLEQAAQEYTKRFLSMEAVYEPLSRLLAVRRQGIIGRFFKSRRTIYDLGS